MEENTKLCSAGWSDHSYLLSRWVLLRRVRHVESHRSGTSRKRTGTDQNNRWRQIKKAKNSKLLAEAEQDNQYFINVVSDGKNAAFWMQTGRFGGSSWGQNFFLSHNFLYECFCTNLLSFSCWVFSVWLCALTTGSCLQRGWGPGTLLCRQSHQQGAAVVGQDVSW